MLLHTITAVLVLVVQQNNACLVKGALRLVQKAVIRWDGFDERYIKSLSINEKNVDIRYWNSKISTGIDYRESIKINYEHEYKIADYWIPGLPLKVFIHGWLDSIVHKDGVFGIKSAYLKTGGYNLISVDWAGIAGNRNYMLPVLMTTKIGAKLAKMLDNIVGIGLVAPKDIHLIGHSLGAHIAGICGSMMKSGQVGRITGLDPAGPGFEYAMMENKGLKKSDAMFVDVIHTSGGSTGIYQSIGHADFFPNGGSVPQPGCYKGMQFGRIIGVIGCSHSRAYKLYEDSVYHPGTMIAYKCKSWNAYLTDECVERYTTPMGHGASPISRGDFYLRTRKTAPFDFPDEQKKDL